MRKQLVLLLLAGVVLASCVKRDYPALEQQMSSDLSRQLWEQMYEGDRLLKENLLSSDMQPLVFQIADKRTVKAASHCDTADLFNEYKIIFYTKKDAKGAVQYWYFNPRELVMIPVENPAKPFYVFRAVPSGNNDANGKRQMHIYRYGFQVDGLMNLTMSKAVAVTASPGNYRLPVADISRNTLYFLDMVSEERHVLMTSDLDGSKCRQVFKEQNFDIVCPRIFPDGRFIVAANHEGYYRLYQINGSGGLTTFDGKIPDAPNTNEMMLGSTFENGRAVPAVFNLPEKIGLNAVYALVSARNSDVNQKRALLAAALLESGQAKLANYPTLSFDLAYTPVVGVFLDKPVTYSGDYLAEGITRGLLGLIQPLTDFKKNAAISEASICRAKIAGLILKNEINEQTAQAAENYFEAQFLRKLNGVNEELVRTASQRVEHYRKLKNQEEATRLQMHAADNILVGLLSERAYYSDRLNFVETRLKELCGLPARARLNLADEHFRFDKFVTPPLPELSQIALLNHPRMKISETQIAQSFYLRQGGPGLMPEMYVESRYGQSRRDLRSPVDDFISLNLNTRYPLSNAKARKIHDQYWKEVLASQWIDKDARARALARQLEEARMDFVAAQNDYLAKNASVDYYLEGVRSARLFLELFKPGEAEQQDPLKVVTARIEYLTALQKQTRVEMDLGSRFVKLWREMGLSERVPSESVKWVNHNFNEQRASVWVWKTREVIADGDALEKFVAFARKAAVKKVYLYLEDGKLLEDQLLRERVLLFIHECSKNNVQVWALLGEPEWLKGDEKPLTDAVARIIAFNSRLGQLEPKIEGLKLDLEPHSLPGWDKPETRAELTKKYLTLLSAAKTKLAGQIPVWVDCPISYFEDKQLIANLTALTDGVTLMCYYKSEEKIMANAEISLKAFTKNVEIGLEFSDKVSPEISLAATPYKDFFKMCQKILSLGGKYGGFEGIALHDYASASKYYERGGQ